MFLVWSRHSRELRKGCPSVTSWVLYILTQLSPSPLQHDVPNANLRQRSSQWTRHRFDHDPLNTCVTHRCSRYGWCRSNSSNSNSRRR